MKKKRENPEIVYKCRYCGQEYEDKAEFEEECGEPQLTKDHFKPGDLVRWRNGRVFEIRYIDDTGFVGLYKHRDYIVAFGHEGHPYGGPWAAPAGKFCKNSLKRLDLDVVKKQLRLREKQFKSAQKLCAHLEGKSGSDGNTKAAPRRTRKK